MDSTTYPGSDTDVYENYENSDFHSMASNEINFVDHWVNLTVEKEVLKGSQLRNEKLKSYLQKDDYEIVSINLVRPPVPGVDINMCYQRKRSPGRSSARYGSFSPRSNSPRLTIHSYSQANSPQKMDSRPNMQRLGAKGVIRCPMRIVELAVPTKRQCIDTWRNKCDVLPPFMVERLRQQIMDEKPVVQIKEAISCFQRRKTKSVKSIKRCNMSARDFKLKNDRMMYLRNFCSVFSRKIAQRLITPKNIQLTPQLGNLSNVVSDEISKVIHNQKKFNIDVQANEKIQAEMAAKIAIWIAMIQQDACYKLLEEDLRVKKRFENNEVKDERFSTLIGKSLHHEKTSELEEEEGPVLDFIDNVLDNVVTICEPHGMDIESIDNISETTSKGDQYDRSVASREFIENHEFNTSTLYTNVTYDTGDGTISKSNEMEPQDTMSAKFIQEIDNESFEPTVETNINDHIRREVVKIVNSVINTDDKMEEINLSSDTDIGNKTKDNLENENHALIEHIDFLQESPGNSDLAHSKKDEYDSNLAVVKNVVSSPKNSSEDRIDDPKSTVDDNVLSPRHSVENKKDDPKPLLEDIVLSSKSSENRIENSKSVVEEVVLSPKNSSMDGIDDDNILSSRNSVENKKDDSKPLFEAIALSSKLSENGIENSKSVVEEVVLSPKNSSKDGIDDSELNLENINAENHHVSDVFERFDEESLDDKNKKVKFFEIRMDIEGHARQLDSNRALNSKEENEKKIVSSTNIHDLVFAPPNEHLLSDADESWPDDLVTPIVKPSANVNRSVTSMGNILEYDEKILVSEDEICRSLDWEATNQTELEIVDKTRDRNNLTSDPYSGNIQISNEKEVQIAEDELKDKTTHEKNSEDSITNETESSINTIKMREEKFMIDKIVDANVTSEPDTKRLVLDSSTSPIKIQGNDDAPDLYETREKEADMAIKTIESDTNIIFEAVQQKMKSSYAIPKYDYKVHPNMAPPWLRHDHGIGEPSEDSFRVGKCKEKNKDTEIRNWCKDLDRILVNLEMWNGWIDNTCKNVIYLKQKRETNKLVTPNARRKDAKDWIALKKNVDKDAVVWTKLNQKAYERLKTYKDKTKIVSTEYCVLCDCKNYTKRKV